MTNDKLAALIAREKKNLENYRAKSAEYADKAKKTEAKLARLEMMQDSKKFTALSDVVKQSGLSMEDVFMALQSGDLLSLQERMEAAQAAQKAEESEAKEEPSDELDPHQIEE